VVTVLIKLYSNIKRLREEKGLSQDALAKLTGYTDRSSITKIEKGLVDLQQSKIELFAKALGTTAKELVGWDNESDTKKHGVVIKVLGHVAAGIPIEAIEDVIDTEEITEELAKTGEFFGLRIKGDSMTPTICDGDIVIVRQQDDAENGDIVIATVNGDEATCKRLRKYKDGIELISINPSYSPFEFSNDEIMEKPVKIIGKVVESRRKF
jgi:lexA repressor